MSFDKLADIDSLKKTVRSLEEKGYKVSLVQNGAEALEKIKSLIPKGASVMNGSSVTLEKIGYSDFLKSDKNGWDNLHGKVTAEDDPLKRTALRKQAMLSDYYLGSVNAVTVDGQMVIASNTGSQIPHLASTSPNLILVVGTQKIVVSLEEAIKRIEEYVYPLEDAHLKEKFGVGTGLNKILIFRNENSRLGRKINIILVKEILGF